MLALPTGTGTRRPIGASTMGFVWRGQNNYCLAPLLLGALVFNEHPRRGSFYKIKFVQFFDGLTLSQVNELFIVVWVTISVIYYV